MLFQIISFELKYRLKRPPTYIYFLLVFLVGFLSIAWEDFSQFGAGGQIKMNASYALYQLMGTISFIPLIFVSSAVMGVPIVRDYEHKMESILFTTNITKFDYLFGRFIGSLIILIVISSAALLGPIIGSFMPWVNHDKLVPFSWMHYLSPYFFLLSSVLIQAMFYFGGGILGKRMLFVYMQCIIFTGLNILAQVMLTDAENLNRAGIVDISGSYAINLATRYWTIIEKNTSLISFTGVLLWNRLLWAGIGLLFMLIACWAFKFRIIGAGKTKKKKAAETTESSESIALPEVAIGKGFIMNWQRFGSSLKIYFIEIIKSLPFWGIAIFGIVILLINATYTDEWYGTGNWPVTNTMIDVIGGLSLYFYGIVVYYSGELVWREKDVQFDQIHDALPMPDVVKHVAKLTALMLSLIVLYAIAILLGVFMQSLKGYYNYELPVYFEFVGNRLLNFLIVACVAFFFQLIVRNKFIGFALTIGFLMIDFVKGQLGLRHPLVSFNSGDLGIYSDMNHFAASTANFFWLKTYWLGFALIIFTVGILLSIRGTNNGWKLRLQSWHSKFDMPMKLFMVLGLILFIGAGAKAFVNYNSVNKYETEKEQDKKKVRFEKDLRGFEFEVMPEVAEMNLKINLYPEKLNADAQGYYWLKNIDSKPISKLYIQLPMVESVKYKDLKFDRPFAIEKEYTEHHFIIYNLRQPLIAGDSIKMSFDMQYQKKGFGNPDANFVNNGTFFDNTAFLPMLGYSASNGLTDMDKRKKYGLPAKDNKYERNDSSRWKYNLFTIRTRSRFEITVSTSPDQIAVAPGYLQKEWIENNRHYFYYKMDQPIFPFVNIVSAKFAVKRSVWNGINLEVYYHPSHTYNIDSFLVAMKDALEYNTTHYGPYPFRQLRILEFPRYRSFAQSFPNTVPYSEIMGFIMKKNKPDDLDMAYYVTAHEVGHQWWGHQVCEAGVKGGQMFSESLSQYSALMTLKKKSTQEQLKKYLKYELDNYLRSRSGERKKENPLCNEDGQGYIYYQKGTMVYYALQDYLGEDKVNGVLRRLVDKWAWRQDQYPISDTLVKYFQEATPDSLQYLITDLFTKIVLYDNKVINPTYKKISANDYAVTIPVSSIKYVSDSIGNETKVPLKDLIPIGVFGKNKNGKDSLLLIQKIWMSNDKSTYTVHVKSKPAKAGIDPINMLIDRDTNDNVAEVEEQ